MRMSSGVCMVVVRGFAVSSPRPFKIALGLLSPFQFGVPLVQKLVFTGAHDSVACANKSVYQINVLASPSVPKLCNVVPVHFEVIAFIGPDHSITPSKEGARVCFCFLGSFVQNKHLRGVNVAAILHRQGHNLMKI